MTRPVYSQLLFRAQATPETVLEVPVGSQYSVKMIVTRWFLPEAGDTWSLVDPSGGFVLWEELQPDPLESHTTYDNELTLVLTAGHSYDVFITGAHAVYFYGFALATP